MCSGRTASQTAVCSRPGRSYRSQALAARRSIKSPMTGGRNVLIVFGAMVGPDGNPSPALKRRIEGATAFGRSVPDALYLVTGGRGRSGFVEAEIMRAGLLAAGVDPAAIVCETASTDTLGSVVRAARLIAGWPKPAAIHVCTSPYHQPRCLLLLRMAGVPVRKAPMPSDRPAMGRLALFAAWLREAAAIAYDVAVLKLRGKGSAIWP